MTTRVITLWRVHVMLLTTSVLTVCFLIEIKFILNAIKSRFKGSHDKQNLTLEVISYEIYKTRRRLASYIIYEMTTRVYKNLYLSMMHALFEAGDEDKILKLLKH